MASHAMGDGGIPPRDAAERGLRRIMTLGGAYGTRNYTVRHLRDQKGKRVLVETLPFSPEEAAAAEEAGIDTMKVRFDPRQPEPAAAIRHAAPNTFMAFSVPLLAAATEAEAVRLGYDAMAIGADAIMCQWSPRLVAAATEAGVPIQGHAGLVPRRSTWTGGLRAVGKTLDEALWVYREIKALEGCGGLRGRGGGHSGRASVRNQPAHDADDLVNRCRQRRRHPVSVRQRTYSATTRRPTRGIRSSTGSSTS